MSQVLLLRRAQMPFAVSYALSRGAQAQEEMRVFAPPAATVAGGRLSPISRTKSQRSHSRGLGFT